MSLISCSRDEIADSILLSRLFKDFNFLHYYYTIYKLCELLNQHQYLPLLSMLNDREKIIEQDAI